MSKSFLKTVLYMVLSSVGQISSRFTYNCILPDSSCISAKDADPIIRKLIKRPATLTSLKSNLLCFQCIKMSLTLVLVVKPSAGYGSMPSFINSSLFCLLSISCSLKSMVLFLVFLKKSCKIKDFSPIYCLECELLCQDADTRIIFIPKHLISRRICFFCFSIHNILKCLSYNTHEKTYIFCLYYSFSNCQRFFSANHHKG